MTPAARWLLLASLAAVAPAAAQEARPAAPDPGVEGTESEASPREVVANRLRLSDIADLGVRLRVQPRLDVGDLVTSRDGSRYDTDQDAYLRRLRVSFTGTALRTLRYVVTLDGDRIGQNGRPNQVRVTDAAIEWKPFEELALRVGRAKLPVTRSGLTSSARQLLVDRPLSVDAARGLFDDVDQVNLYARSRLLGGVVTLYAAAADGWAPGAQLYASGAGRTVRASHPAAVARLELAPPGLTEAHKSDAHLGEGSHLVLGVDAGVQERIEYADAAGSEDRRMAGLDLSAHLGPLTAQGEARWWQVRSTVATRGDVRPYGLYAQVGYYVRSLQLEPTARYELYVEDSTRSGARQKVFTAGVNAYLARHNAKLQVAWVHRSFEAAATGRLAGADQADVLQVQGQLYL